MEAFDDSNLRFKTSDEKGSVLKTSFPILVTEAGIITLSKLWQSKKAPFLIVTTEEGITIFFSLLQSEYLQPIITQYFIDNKSEIWLLFFNCTF